MWRRSGDHLCDELHELPQRVVPQGNLDLGAPGLADRLVGKSATGGSGLLVDHANPEGSVLYRKLSSPAPFGGVMPAVELDANAKACVLAWIKSL